jgi:hypothetical protein
MAQVNITYASSFEDTPKQYFSIALEPVRHIKCDPSDRPGECRLNHYTGWGKIPIRLRRPVHLWLGSIFSRTTSTVANREGLPADYRRKDAVQSEGRAVEDERYACHIVRYGGVQAMDSRNEAGG